jgi:hypothetical protein
LEYRFCGSFVAVKNRMTATKVARQKIITGESTYEMLQEIFGKLEQDKPVMRCLEVGLLPVNER